MLNVELNLLTNEHEYILRENRVESRIAAVFHKLKSNQQMAFMPFITAGDPDLEGTKNVLKELSSKDVDLIEIGFPYLSLIHI